MNNQSCNLIYIAHKVRLQKLAVKLQNEKIFAIFSFFIKTCLQLKDVSMTLESGQNVMPMVLDQEKRQRSVDQTRVPQQKPKQQGVWTNVVKVRISRKCLHFRKSWLMQTNLY